MPENIKYLSCFFLPGSVTCFLATGPHGALSALAWTLPLWAIILVDWLGPKIKPNNNLVVLDGYYNFILYSLALLQFLNIFLLVIYASQLHWSSEPKIAVSLLNLIVIRIMVGSASGSSAIIVAHELIHRNKPHMQVLGRLLLYTVCYEHFIIAHGQGHHATVATTKDIATARLGESFSDYWRRTVSGYFKYAWNFELQRLNLARLPWYHYKMLANSVLQGLIIEFILVLVIVIIFGWVAGFIFLYQALSGTRLLETINYYQHWGLEQGRAENTLAWVNQSSLTRYVLICLSNHIEHHKNPITPFYLLPYSDQGPKMPYGYFVTNLWVKIRNQSYRRVSEKILKNYYSSTYLK